MDVNDERIEYAARNTEILRPPKQSLSTFGTTNLYYYLVTEPSYSELVKEKDVVETVVREGRVITERPKIVTPYYLSNLEGFSAEARRYFDALIRAHGPNAPGLFYAYRNEPGQLNIVSDSITAVISRINEEIDRKGDPLSSIIKGEDDLWDVSLLKFIYEVTKNSLRDNMSQLGSKGLLNVDSSGMPLDARLRIEELFRQVIKGERDSSELKSELDRWNVYAEYEDRFLSIFKKKR
jgi:hypothetical protein